MMGGGFMLFFGVLFMLLVIGLPVLLFVAILAGLWRPLSRRSEEAVTSSGNQGTDMTAVTSTRLCSHCGQGLQPEWKHCSNCGAPV